MMNSYVFVQKKIAHIATGYIGLINNLAFVKIIDIDDDSVVLKLSLKLSPVPGMVIE